MMDCDPIVSDVDKEIVAPLDNKYHSDNTNWCLLQKNYFKQNYNSLEIDSLRNMYIEGDA